MPSLHRSLVLATLWGLLPVGPAVAQVTLLHSFAGGAGDGQNPEGSLTLSGSTLYGMTLVGGNSGTIFKIGANGTGFALLHSFAGGLNDGSTPNGSLALAGTTLYGLTQFGGSATSRGTAFRLNADGTGFGLVHRFAGGLADGENPLGTPVVSGLTLYGMTSQGGSANIGTVFKVNADGTNFGLLHSFAGGPADGQAPGFSALVQSGPTLFGMTGGGGPTDDGTVFKVNTDGTGFTLLHAFSAPAGDGWLPYGSPVLVGSTLYGMTRQGGGAAGTIFKINTDGTGYARLHAFTGTPTGDGAGPLGSLLLSGSTLYGMTTVGGTANLGTVFQINADGTGYQVLHSFLGGPFDGADPQGDLTLVGSSLYGMTVAGGSNNLGTIFSFPIAVPEPSSLVLAGAAAAVLATRRWRAG